MQSIYAHPGGSLAIGRRGENEARQVVFDLSAWRAAYGDGAAALCHQRAGDSTPTPASSSRMRARPGGRSGPPTWRSQAGARRS